MKKKWGGNPVLLFVAFVGFSISIYGFHNYAYKPWSRRRRLAQSEEYANFLISKGYGPPKE